ncbi:MAG: thermonuclease family protein [Pseudomonadota bacterium]
MKRIADFLKVTLFLLLLAGSSAWLAVLSADEVSGTARVIDGDSLMVGEREIRLYGIDAPEYRQMCNASSQAYPCGREAAGYLRELVRHADVACRGNELDKYERLIAVCKIAGIDINREMVLNGWAVSFGDYESEQADARNQSAGLWQSEFDLPSQWRRDEKQKHSRSWLSQIFSW